MRTSCNTKPQRGVTMVASRFNGSRTYGTLSVNILITSH